MTRICRLQLALGCAVLSLSADACASTIGVTSGTLPMGTLGAPSGVREQVELEPVGAQLVGRLKSTSIEQIVLTAPGIERAQLMLREVRQMDGRVALHLTATPTVASATIRATLVLRDSTPHHSVVITTEGRSIERALIRVPTVSGERLAVPVQGLGSFWLVAGSHESERAPTSQSVRDLLGLQGSPSWLPVWLGLVLLSARAGSRWAHRLQVRRNA